MSRRRETSTAAPKNMWIQASPTKLNNVYGIKSEATTKLSLRFIFADKSTDREIIIVGIETEIIPTSVNACEISNVNTFPARMSSSVPGM